MVGGVKFFNDVYVLLVSDIGNKIVMLKISSVT